MKPLRPTLWRTCRAIANPARLDLLRLLFAESESSVCALAAETGVSEQVASAHLRVLRARGMLTARPSGRWVYYVPRANPEVDNAELILQTLRTCCKKGMTNEEIVQCATAFTHKRRIGIIAALNGSPLKAEDLSHKVQVPLPSLFRHLQKLKKREMVDLQKGTYSFSYPENLLGLVLVQIALQEG